MKNLMTQWKSVTFALLFMLLQIEQKYLYRLHDDYETAITIKTAHFLLQVLTLLLMHFPCLKVIAENIHLGHGKSSSVVMAIV